MSEHRKSTKPNSVNLPQRPTPDVMTIDDAAAAYDGEWILLELTEIDDQQNPVAGIVVEHHPKRSGIQPAVMRVIASPSPTAKGYYVFSGYRRFYSGAEWDAYVAQRDQQGLAGA